MSNYLELGADRSVKPFQMKFDIVYGNEHIAPGRIMFLPRHDETRATFKPEICKVLGNGDIYHHDPTSSLAEIVYRRGFVSRSLVSVGPLSHNHSGNLTELTKAA